MIGISTKHFCESMQLGKNTTTVNRVYNGLKRVLRDRGYAILYINGCSYYIKPMSESSMGFGSGKLEIIFNNDDSEESIKTKLLEYFSKRYTDVIGYGGRDYSKATREEIEKYCTW